MAYLNKKSFVTLVLGSLFGAANATPLGVIQLDIVDVTNNEVLETNYVGLPTPTFPLGAFSSDPEGSTFPLRFLSSDPLACDVDKMDVADPIATGYALVVERGECTFEQKLLNAASFNASAVLILNTLEGIYQNTSASLPVHVLKNPCSINCDLAKSTDKEKCESNPKCPSKLCTNNPTTDFLSSASTDKVGPYCCVEDTVINSLSLNATRVENERVFGSMVSINGGEKIKKLRTEKGDLSMKVVFSIRETYDVDPGIIVMFFLGSLVTALAAFRATAGERYEALYKQDDVLPTDAQEQPRDNNPTGALLPDEEVVEISTASAVIFLAFASVFLIAMFYLTLAYPHEAVIALNVLFMLGSINAVATVLFQPVVGRLFPGLKNYRYVLAEDLRVNGVEILSTLIAAACSISWFITRHEPTTTWIYLDVASFAISCMFLSLIKLPSLKVTTILFGCFFIYDIFMVFISPLIFGGRSVMLQVATAGGATSDVIDPVPDPVPGTNVSQPVDPSNPDSPLIDSVPYCSRKMAEKVPMLFLIPRFGWEGEFVLLGLGDVFIPGLLVALALRVDYANARKGLAQLQSCFSIYRYYVPVAVSYAAGLALTFTANLLGWTINGVRGQPALLYLCPFTLGTFVAVAWFRGQLGPLWRGDWDPDAQAAAKDSATNDGSETSRSEEEGADDVEGNGERATEHSDVVVQTAEET